MEYVLGRSETDTGRAREAGFSMELIQHGINL